MASNHTSGSRLKHNILTGLFLALFCVALVCSIIALVKSPTAPADNPAKVDKPSVDTPSTPDTPDKPQTPDSPAGTVQTVSEVTTVVSYLDSTGNMPIAEVAKKLLEQLINTASASEQTAYTVTKIEWATDPAIIDHTMAPSSSFSAPLSTTTWFVSSKAKVEFTGQLTVDENSETFLGGRYIVKSGKNYTLYQQAEYEKMSPSDIPSSFVWGEYDATTTVAGDEMYLSSGIKLAMTFDAVETKLGGFDSLILADSARERTAVKGSYTYTFSLVDSKSTASDDWGLPHDGQFYLTKVSASSACTDEFPRGVKVGDSMTNVLTKFPNQRKTDISKLWANQRIYGADKQESGVALALLQYQLKRGAFRIYIQDTGRESISILFDKSYNVEGFEWIYQK